VANLKHRKRRITIDLEGKLDMIIKYQKNLVELQRALLKTRGREIAAIYCRLSQDDGDLGESGSIQTQKAILTRYCKENHITIGDCY
jgi:hypothetical protein